MKREKHSDEERLKVVERYLDCGSAKLTAKEFGVDRHCVMEWAEGFRLYGIEGVMRRPPRKFTPEEKQKIILSCQKKCVPLHDICALYGVSRSSLYFPKIGITNAGEMTQGSHLHAGRFMVASLPSKAVPLTISSREGSG